MLLPDQNLDWPIPYEAVCEIAKSESCRLRAYLCSAGVPTIGWGHTEGVKLGMTMTQKQADATFLQDMIVYTKRVRMLMRMAPTDHQLGAMVSLAFNIGLAGFATSTVLKQHNLGNYQAASRAFGLWNKVTKGGKKVVERGLTLRRAREAAFYLTPDAADEDALYSIPQRVAGESSLATSPIAQSGTLSALTGITALLSAVVAPIREFADGLGIDPLMVVAGVAVAAGVVTIWQRRKQRTEGWA